MTKEEQFREMVETLLDLVGTIDVTGGVSYNADGEPEPAGDPEWIDLGDVHVRAKRILEEVCQCSLKNLGQPPSPPKPDPRDVRILELEHELAKLRYMLREPMAHLFGLSVRDLELRSSKRNLWPKHDR